MKRLNEAMRFAAVCILVGAAAFAGSPSVQAQDSTSLPTKNVTITLNNAPIRTALDALFKNANINYTMDAGIAGNVTVNLTNVPFDTALHAILRSSTPPLQYKVVDNIYQIMEPSASNTIASPNQGQSTTQTASDQNGQGTATETKQAVVIYLTYASGALLNAVVGPVSIIQPALTTPGSNGGTSGGGTTGGGLGGGSTGGGFGGGSTSSFGGGGGGFGGGAQSIGGGGQTTTGFASGLGF